MRIEGFRERLQTKRAEILKFSSAKLSNPEASALAADDVLFEINLDLIEGKISSEADDLYFEIDKRQGLISNSQVYGEAIEKVLKDEEDRLGGVIGLTDDLYGGVR